MSKHTGTTYGPVPLIKELHECHQGNPALIVSLRCLEGLESDGAAIIETPTENGSKSTTNRFVGR